MATPTFTNNVNDNVRIAADLLKGILPEHRRRAARAANAIEQLVLSLRRDNPNDPAVAIGTFYALSKICQMIVTADNNDERNGKGLIQLL